MPKVKIIKVTFSPASFKPADIPRLRGFLARTFPHYEQIHNHTENGRFKYTYPELQFKFIKGTPVIVGYNKGVEILKEVFNKVGYLELNHRKIDIPEKSIQLKEEQIGVSEEFKRYNFVTPWMALKEENFETYKQTDNKDRQIFLNHLLRENLKTISHAFDYWIPDPEKIKVNSNLKMKLSPFKGNMMVTFTGEFLINFNIPDYLGIGKQVARGYGTVKSVA